MPVGAPTPLMYRQGRLGTCLTARANAELKEIEDG
jgi:hypothetical protein